MTLSPSMVRLGHNLALLEGWTLQTLRGVTGSPTGEVVVRGRDGAELRFDQPLLGRHVLFLGAIGTGKTVGMSSMLASLRQHADGDDVFVIFDTKGDYLGRFWQPGDAVLSSARDAHQPGKVFWNLFEDIHEREPGPRSDEIRELAAALFTLPAGQSDERNSIFRATAEDLFGATVDALARDGAAHSNEDLRRLIDTASIQDLKDLLGPHPDLRGALQYIAKEGTGTTQSTQIYLQQTVRSILAGGFRLPGDFSVRRFLRQKGARALFVEYDVGAGSLLSAVYKTILDLAFKEALSRDRTRGRVYFVLDEFALLPQLNYLENGLNFGRSLGLRFVVGTQNVGQVFHAYGPDKGEAVLAAFGTVFAFRLYDAASRQFVRDRFGANRKLLRFESAIKARGVVEQPLDGTVVEDWDLTELGVGQVIAGLPDGPPIRVTLLDTGGGGQRHG